jgi:hypothetical protein
MTEPSTTDLLRDLCNAWESFYDDAAGPWEARMNALVAASRLHLNPVLVEDDPAPSVRCLP